LDDQVGLRQAAELASSAIRDAAEDQGRILVISHFSADALAAAGILVRSLRELSLHFQVRVVSHLSADLLREASAREYDKIIFAGIGSDDFDLISSDGIEVKSIVLDQHEPGGPTPRMLVHVNPHEFGLRGSRDLSASGIAYLVCRNLLRVPESLVGLAVVGALGSMQDLGEWRSLVGVNRLICEEGIRAGRICADRALLLFGREALPIHRSIASTMIPYLPGLSGDEQESLNAVKRADIQTKIGERWRRPTELGAEEKARLAQAVAHETARHAGTAQEIEGVAYRLTDEDPMLPTSDAREYAFLLSACGALGKFGLAVSICAGDRDGALREARTIAAQYARSMVHLASVARKVSGRVQLGSCTLVNAIDLIGDGMASSASTALCSSGVMGKEKVALIISKATNGYVRVSARAGGRIAKKGLKLGSIFRELAMKHSGMSYGHDTSADAIIPMGREDSFVSELDSTIAGSIGSA